MASANSDDLNTSLEQCSLDESNKLQTEFTRKESNDIKNKKTEINRGENTSHSIPNWRDKSFEYERNTHRAKPKQIRKTNNEMDNLLPDKHAFKPSKERIKDYVYFPETFENDGLRKSMNGGKWLVFVRGDMEMLDKAWVAFQTLFRDGLVVGIKSSTGTDEIEGVLMCYTSDRSDENAVRRAANRIRELIPYREDMYYKTNEASFQGKYRREGSKCIALYKSHIKNELFISDGSPEWKLIHDE